MTTGIAKGDVVTEDTGPPARARYTINHFQQSNPRGPGEGDVPALLRRIADSIEELGDVDVYDLVLNPPTISPEDDGWPSIAVYYDDRVGD